MSEFKKALEKYAKYVIQQSRSNLTKKKNNASKQLYNSLEYKIQGDKISFLSEKYGEYLDKGVKGSKSTYPESSASPFKYTTKQPPSKAFDKWSIRKGIAPRDKQGRFVSRLFFTKPFERGLDLYGDEIVAGYLEDKLNLQ
jgi:hypothetical protein